MFFTFIFSFMCFLLTSVGAGTVFIIKKNTNKITSILHSFSAGVMLASSIFSLIIPAIEYCDLLNIKSWLVFGMCFVLAYIMFYVMDSIQNKSVDNKFDIKLLAISMAIHNIPEGMCIGFAFAGANLIGTHEAIISAIMISVGIGIQNIPEGSSLSFSLRVNGCNKMMAFFISSAVGFIEVPSGLIAYIIGVKMLVILPYMLVFAAAVMICVACTSLMPEAVSIGGKAAMTGLFLGFIVMMILDLALGWFVFFVGNRCIYEDLINIIVKMTFVIKKMFTNFYLYVKIS